MANIALFSIRVKGKSESELERFFDSQKFLECYSQEYKKIKDNNYLFFNGECRWGLNKDSKVDLEEKNLSDYSKEELLGLSLKDKSKLFNVEIEAFDYAEDNDGYAGHYRYNNGDTLVEEEIDLRDNKKIKYSCDKDEEGKKYNFWDVDFEKAFKLGTKDESVDKKEEIKVEEIDSNPDNFAIRDGILNCYTGSASVVKIPEGVKQIHDYAFRYEYSFKKIKKIILPNSLEELPGMGFADFKQLEELDLPNPMIPYYGDNMFGLQYYESEQPKIMKNKFVVAGTALFYCNQNTEIVEVPEGITVIRDGAFWGLDKVKKVILPNTTQNIFDEAFVNLKFLKEIVIPKNVNNLSDNIIRDCKNAKITISE